MVNKRRRSLRAALVVCSPRLDQIHGRLFSALGIHESGDLGRPGGSCLLLPGARRAGTFSTEREFGLKYLASEWLSKLDDGKSSASKTAMTWTRFEDAESSCREINRSLPHRWFNEPYKQEILLARKLVRKILGDFSWDEAARHFEWGPGASTRLPRRKSDAAFKYCGNPQTTIGNAALAIACIKHVPVWEKHLPLLDESEGLDYVKIVDGNRIVTVPKNYKTDRTIAIEPDMNMYVQKGIGAVMRRRLKRHGCDLNDQSLNQRLARLGSTNGSLATIDLSMASDTVSRAVVELLIPGAPSKESCGEVVANSWFDAIWQSRSPWGVLPSGEKIFYQKFSSMGNGYTFELETVIFLSLARAYATIHGLGEELTKCINVYGDDIIVPADLAPGFCGLLQHLGFLPNAKKSYWTGEFRESCGKHFYRGLEVTPFYVKRAPRTLIDLFKIHNQIWRFEKRSDWLTDEDREGIREVLGWLRSYAPSRFRKPSLVDGIGDGGFVGEFDEILPDRCPRGWDGYRFKSVLALTPYNLDFEEVGILVKSLHNLERRSKDFVTLLIGDELGPVRHKQDLYPAKPERFVEGEVFANLFVIGNDSTPLP